MAASLGMKQGQVRAPVVASSSKPCTRALRVASPTVGRSSWALRATETDATAAATLELLRKENELLRQTLQETEGAIEGVQVVIDAAEKSASAALVPEDFWTPSVSVPDGTAMVEQYGEMTPVPEHDGTACFKWDNQLWSKADHFRYRWKIFKDIRVAIDFNEGGMKKFTEGYKHYGLNRGEHNGVKGIWYREWAPNAKALALVGEFNNWDPKGEHWAIKNPFGVWELFLPDVAGKPAIAHRTKVKCRLETSWGQWVERIPAWIKWATQEWNEILFNGVYYDPPEVSPPGVLEADKTYTFKYPRPPRPRALRIYECHIGMSSNEPKVNSYTEFKNDMLPRIRKLGYNAIQIMAIQEHAYYGSFGYHVTNFFGVSSRCGTPDELKAMIDEAHRLGLMVLMDIVHSHASKNTNDGLNMFDGSDAMYFHEGPRGNHWVWDSRCFNYGNWETLRFLLSNSRYWMEEFKFDGYRFDGVTSMMYHHHGLNYTFTGHFDEYFGMNTDVDAVVYLMLVNNMLHDFYPNCVTIGEDVSGMPAFCRPWQEGGVGFDYRLQMAIADKWIEVLKKLRDDQWSMGDLCFTMTNRRYMEACIGYAESHDQALVGDKTIAFWLMDAAMYDCMAAPGFGNSSPVVDRGIALHKMIRMLTITLGGEGYLNFMGNEFGHPEWIDFPRDDFVDPSTGKFIKGNGGSLEKCRRRWDLADSEVLKYKYMQAFDRAMCHLDKAFGYTSAPHTYISRKDEGDKVVVVERGDLVFVFNFNPTQSFSDYRVGANMEGPYKVVLSSDEEVFGGWRNITKDNDTQFATSQGNHDNRPYSFQVYAPSRTVVAYAKAEFCDKDAERKPYGIPGLAVKDVGPYFAV